MDEKGKINELIKIRDKFEEMILEHPAMMKLPIHRLGSGPRTRGTAVSLFGRIFELLSLNGAPARGVWKVITNQPEYSFLISDEKEHQEATIAGAPGKPFSSKTKSAAYLAQALPSAPKCCLCGGLLHTNGITADHEVERSQGGSSAVANARYVHPFCNSNRKAIGL